MVELTKVYLKKKKESDGLDHCFLFCPYDEPKVLYVKKKKKIRREFVKNFWKEKIVEEQHGSCLKNY